MARDCLNFVTVTDRSSSLAVIRLVVFVLVQLLELILAIVRTAYYNGRRRKTDNHVKQIVLDGYNIPKEGKSCTAARIG
jgi:hypothetical protein